MDRPMEDFSVCAGENVTSLISLKNAKMQTL